MNDSTIATLDPPSRSWWHILVLLFFFLATLSALAGYGIVLKIFLKYRKTDFNNQFYILAVNLAVADCVCLCYYAISLFLAMIGHAALTMQHWHQPILATYFATATLTFAIAINRLVAVVMFQSYSNIFNGKVTVVVAILCWLVGFSVYLSMIIVECRIPFHDFAFVYVCYQPRNTTAVMINFGYNEGVSLFSCIGAAICYTIIVASRKKLLTNFNAQTSNNHARRKEWKLVIQGMLISGLFVAYVLTYWSMYSWHVFENLPPQAVELGVMSLQIAAPATNPLCYITCSSKVRKHCLKMFKIETQVNRMATNTNRTTRQAKPDANRMISQAYPRMNLVSAEDI